MIDIFIKKADLVSVSCIAIHQSNIMVLYISSIVFMSYTFYRVVHSTKRFLVATLAGGLPAELSLTVFEHRV